MARAKLARKGCDLLVVNDVSGGAVFGSPDNEAVVLSAAGEPVAVPRGTKSALAHVIWDQVAATTRLTVDWMVVPQAGTPVIVGAPHPIDIGNE